MAHLFLYVKIITSVFSTFLDTSILLLATLSFIPCSGSPLSTNVGYSGSIFLMKRMEVELMVIKHLFGGELLSLS